MRIILAALLAVCFSLPLFGDKKKVFESTKAKAVGGDAEAQSNLGLMYEIGEGVPEDYKEAVKWYCKAAEQGNAIAQSNLGLMYYHGDGVPEDDKEAVKWYRKAAEQGDAEAQYNLGLMYDKGEGVLEDSVTAYAWCNIAAVNGHELAKSQKLNLAKNMTPEQIAKGQELSKEMVKKNPELLN